MGSEVVHGCFSWQFVPPRQSLLGRGQRSVFFRRNGAAVASVVSETRPDGSAAPDHSLHLGVNRDRLSLRSMAVGRARLPTLFANESWVRG